jgi:hypothetical protein
MDSEPATSQHGYHAYKVFFPSKENQYYSEHDKIITFLVLASLIQEQLCIKILNMLYAEIPFCDEAVATSTVM